MHVDDGLFSFEAVIIHDQAFVRIYKFCTQHLVHLGLCFYQRRSTGWRSVGWKKCCWLHSSRPRLDLGRLWKDMSFVFNQRVKEDRLERSGLACRFPSLLRRKGGWQVHQDHPGKTEDHLDPCYWAGKNENYFFLWKTNQLTLQSPFPSPIMAAGSKFKSSRLKSLLISLVKSLFFSALKSKRKIVNWAIFIPFWKLTY